MEHESAFIPGMTGEKSIQVTSSNTALAMGSGSLEVFATPAMAALMEAAAAAAVEGVMPRDSSTVGSVLNIKHLSATPPGFIVRAKAVLKEVDGRVLRFLVEAYDDAGLIGEGHHERVVINIEKFMDKTKSKKPREL